MTPQKGVGTLSIDIKLLLQQVIKIISTDTKNKHIVWSIPVQNYDEVMVVGNTFKGRKCKVSHVYHYKWVMHFDHL